MKNRLFGKRKKEEGDRVLEFKGGSKMHFDADWMQHEFEFQHLNENFRFRANEDRVLKFGEVINSLFDIRKEELSILTVLDGNQTIIEGEDEIWNYEFLNHYKRDEQGEFGHRKGCSNLANQIVMTLGYRTNDKIQSDKDKSILSANSILIVHLQTSAGMNDRAVYVQVTFCHPTARYERRQKGINPSPDCLSILIAYDYRSSEENEQEFINVFNAANEKVAAGKFDELNTLEKEIVKFTHHPIIVENFYLGKRAMAEHRYRDAVGYFNNTYQGLKQKRWKSDPIDEQEFSMFIECSYLIGYCYYELGLFDKAYLYLENAAHSTAATHKYRTEFINCLIALHDIRALMYVDNYLDVLHNKKKEDITDDDNGFFAFLLRRKAYCMIELKDYDQAEDILNYILQYDPENQFANEEMEYIKRAKGMDRDAE